MRPSCKDRLKMNKFRLAAIISLAIVSSVFVALLNIPLSNSQKTSEKVSVLIDASSDNFPPMNLLDKDRNLTGFGQELADAVGRAVGLEIKHIHSSHWNQVLQWLDSGKADFIHDAGYTKERDLFLDYSKPILEMQEMIFVRSDQFDISGFDSLKGKTVSCVDRHISHLYLQSFPEIFCHVVKTPVEGLYELISGKVDAFVYPEQIVVYLSQRLRLKDKIKTIGDPLRTLTWSMVVKEGNEEVLALLNRGIDKVRETNEYDRIYNKWWGKKLFVGYSKREVVIISFITVLVSVIFISLVALLFHNYQLQSGRRKLEREILERKGAERALRKNEEKYRLLVNNANDGILIIQDERVKFFNPIALDLTGYAADELLDMPFSLFIHHRDRSLVLDKYKKRIAGKSVSSTYNSRLVTKRGEKRWIQVNAVRTTWEDKYATLTFIRDITQLKDAEARLQQAEKMESIGNLAGGIAHDFNNILSSIIGFTELALDEVEKDTTIEDSLQEVYTAGKRAKDLVRQILAFARQSDETLKPMNIDAIAREVLKFIRSSIPATIEIKQHIDSDSLTMGNATQIHQVLMNLCTNAADAMEDKGGVLELTLNDISVDRTITGEKLDLQSGQYLEIKVSDTGTGIDPEIIEKIFEPYFTTKAPGEGTGMGLSMAHGIIESYGGRITAESELGKGSTFTIYLPVTRKRNEHRSYETEKLPSGSERVLFVDDEAPLVKMGSQILERLGYSVQTRTSSLEALALFRSKPDAFDLVVTDMTMPNMTGDKLAAEIMSIRPDIPVILCTGYSKKISDESAAEIGIKAFAYKPIIKMDLATTVRKALDEAQGKT